MHTVTGIFQNIPKYLKALRKISVFVFSSWSSDGEKWIYLCIEGEKKKFHNRSIMAALCMLDTLCMYVCVHAHMCCMHPMHTIILLSLSWSLSHNQLVLGRGIHPTQLPPFVLLSQLLSLPLSAPSFPSSSVTSSSSPLLPQPPFHCHFHPVHTSRLDVAD